MQKIFNYLMCLMVLSLGFTSSDVRERQLCCTLSTFLICIRCLESSQCLAVTANSNINFIVMGDSTSQVIETKSDTIYSNRQCWVVGIWYILIEHFSFSKTNCQVKKLCSLGVEITHQLQIKLIVNQEYTANSKMDFLKEN